MRGKTELEDYQVPKSICPYCGYVTDGALEAQPGTKPTPGAISLCMACSGLALFSDTMTLRLPTRAEIIAIRVSPVWQKIWKANLAMESLSHRPKPPTRS